MKNLLVIIIILFTSGRCNLTDYQKISLKHLSQINAKKISIVDTIGWDFYFFKKFNENIEFKLNKYGDTTKLLRFRYWPKEQRYDVYINNTIIRDRKKNIFYHIDIEQDTAFYYTTKNVNDEEKIYIIGKYLNDYRHGPMSKGQRMFFELHEDSLMKVKGNDLPPLPEIN